MTVRLVGALCFVLAGLGDVRADEPAFRGPSVVYVTWDGFRWQEFFGGAQEPYLSKDAGVADIEGVKQRFWREDAKARREILLPFVWTKIAKEGQIFGDPDLRSPAKIANRHKFSYPGYNEMFVGYTDDDRIKSNDKLPNPNVTVLEFLNRRPGFTGRVSAVATWDVFPAILNTERSGVYVHAGIGAIRDGDLTPTETLLNEMIADAVVLWPNNQLDTITMQIALEHIRKRKPRVLFVGLGETDEWGHGRRYDRYLHAAQRSDAFLERLWNLLQSLPEYRGNTTLIVGPDHGRGATIRDWTDHGAKIEGAEFVWSAVLGPRTPPLGPREDVETSLSQIAATIAEAVGEHFRATSPMSAPPLPGAIVPSQR
jgi:hypothetical protein